MSLTVNSISSSNYKPTFGANISVEAARKILRGSYLNEDTVEVYEACKAIAGPEAFVVGINGVVAKCAETLRKQFPTLANIINDRKLLNAQLRVKPLYPERDAEMASLMRRINGVDGAGRGSPSYDLGYLFPEADEMIREGENPSLTDLWNAFKARKGL